MPDHTCVVVHLKITQILRNKGLLFFFKVCMSFWNHAMCKKNACKACKNKATWIVTFQVWLNVNFQLEDDLDLLECWNQQSWVFHMTAGKVPWRVWEIHSACIHHLLSSWVLGVALVSLPLCLHAEAADSTFLFALRSSLPNHRCALALSFNHTALGKDSH